MGGALCMEAGAEKVAGARVEPWEGGPLLGGGGLADWVGAEKPDCCGGEAEDIEFPEPGGRDCGGAGREGGESAGGGLLMLRMWASLKPMMLSSSRFAIILE